MNEIKQYEPLISICQNLLAQLPCDFVGVAIQNQKGPDVRWHYAVGNGNDKYKRITVRYGKGIAGKVISTGRAMEVTNFPNGILGKALEYPIMLAEKLVSSYAVPVFFQGGPKGVLLVGRRVYRPFQDHEQISVQQFVQSLEVLLNNDIKP
ncbi:GAF domain-containing protein [Bacillus sp. V3B]|uniref:GAF domain-containing protein n=1 Tax=Bacillus sp. V3B TaxID=2804915 RepID=UPI0021091BAB|nr:GAF domain-containing protein [Bacillus sp. V3B]MCQ6274364.1 GAF domain-containing protein [Bacillus sp. V3B]